MIQSVITAGYEYFISGLTIGMLSGTVIIALSAIIKIFFKLSKGG